MSKEGMSSLINYDSPNLIAKTPDRSPLPPIFILCDSCYWCATYFDNARVPSDNNCPHCNGSSNDNQLTSFPIMSNESLSLTVSR